MKTVGIVVGTESCWISHKYYQKNKNKLKYLDTLDSSILYKSDAIPFDYAILCEFKALEKKYKVNVVPLHGPTLNLESANECDTIFCVYEWVTSFMDGGYKGYSNFMNVLTKTRATVYPSVKVQRFIINKQQYMTWLKSKGFDIIPTIYITTNSYKKNKQKTLESIYKFVEKGGYKGLVMKPELGGCAYGFKHYKRITDKGINSYFNNIIKKEYKKVTGDALSLSADGEVDVLVQNTSKVILIYI